MSNERYFFGADELLNAPPADRKFLLVLSDEDKEVYRQILSNRFKSDQSETVQALDYVFIKKLHTERPENEVLTKIYERLTKINNVNHYDGFNTILDDELENSEKQINFTLKHTKNEIWEIIHGKCEKGDRTLIQATAGYLRGNARAGSEGRAKNVSYRSKEQEKELIADFVDANHLWFDDDLLTRKFAEGGEQKVYRLNEDYVVKVNDCGFYDSWLEYLESLLLHNLFFSPNTTYELLGFTWEDGELFSVVKQRYIKETRPTKNSETQALLEDIGFENVPKGTSNYYNYTLCVGLMDLHIGNVFTKNDGVRDVLYFIDTIAYINNEPKKFEYGGNLDELNNLEATISKGRQDYQTRGALTVIKWLRANENPNDAQNTNIVLNELKSGIRELGPSVRQIEELFVREPEMKDNADLQETVELYNAYNRVQELYDAWLRKRADEFDYSIFFDRRDDDDEPKVSQEETKAADREEWYQKSRFSKKWAPTFKDAVEKLKQQYFDAQKSKETWEAKQYKKAKGKNVFVGEELSGANVSVDYINEKRRSGAIRGAEWVMKESIEALNDLGFGKEEIADLLNPKADEDTNFCMQASEKSLAKEWEPELLNLIELAPTEKNRIKAQGYGIDFVGAKKGAFSNILTEKKYKEAEDTEMPGFRTFESLFILASKIDQSKPFAVAYFGDTRGNRYEYAAASNDIQELIGILKRHDMGEAVVEIYNPKSKKVYAFILYTENSYDNESVRLTESNKKASPENEEDELLTDEEVKRLSNIDFSKMEVYVDPKMIIPDKALPAALSAKEEAPTTLKKNEYLVWHGGDVVGDWSLESGDFGINFGNKEQAESRLTTKKEGAVKQYIITLQNPLVLHLDFGWWPDSPYWKEFGYVPEDYSGKIIDYLIAEGYDGIIYPNSVEGDGESYIVFNPKAIRPVIEKHTLEQEAIHRYQWMRNKEGGQEYGNQEIIVPENEARYLEFRHLLKDKKMSFADYQKKFGQAYMRYIRMNNKGEWKFHNLNGLDKLKPEQQYFDNGWVIEVTDFNSPEAIKQGSTADSEINVVAGAEAAIGVLEGVTPNMKPTPKFPHGKELLDMTVAQINEAQGMLSSYYWDNFISPKEAEIKDLQFRSKLLPARSPEKAKMKDQILDLQSEVAVYNSESRKTFVDSWIAMSNYLMHWTVSSGLVDKVDESDMEEYFSDMLGDLSTYTFEREREMTWDQKLIDVWLDIVRDHFVNGEKIKLGENYQVPTVACPLADDMEVPVPVASFVNYMLREGKACKLISAGYNTAPIEDILPCWTVHFECIQPLTQQEILTAFENNVKVLVRGKGNYDIYFLLPYKIGPGEASAVKQYLNALEIALARDEFYDLESKGYEDKLKWFAKDLKELKSASPQIRYEREKMLYIDASTSFTKAQLIMFFDTQPNGVEFNANLHGKLVGEWQRSVPGRLRKVDGVYDILRLEGNNVTTLQYGPAFELVDLIFKGEVLVLTEKSPMLRVSVEEKNAVQELPAEQLPAAKLSIEFDVPSEEYDHTTCVISDLASAIERGGCSCADGNDYHFNEYELDQLREILETGETQTFVPVANLKYPLNWVAKMKVEGNFLKLPSERMSTSEYNDVKRIMLKSEGVYNKNAFEFEEPAIDVYLRILGGEEYNMRKKYQYYGTPAATGDYMVKLAEIKCGMKFLEPSAGRAALMNAIWRVCPEAKIDYFEAMPTNLKVLKELSNVAFLGEDFLKIKTSKKYDRIIANPPFSKDQDQAHIRLMYDLLAPKGRLVTVSATHWQFANDKHSTAFREWIAKIGAQVIDVPAGTFKESGTMVPTVIIVADKK